MLLLPHVPDIPPRNPSVCRAFGYNASVIRWAPTRWSKRC